MFTKIFKPFLILLRSFFSKKSNPNNIKYLPNFSPKEKTAIHEAGHAITAYYASSISNLTEISIIPSHKRNGHTTFFLDSNSNFTNLIITMAGFASEILIYKKCSLLQSESDLIIALKLVRNFNESDLKNIISFCTENNIKRYEKSPNFSSIFINQISNDENYLLQIAYTIARFVLIKHKKDLHILIHTLIDHKVINKNLNSFFGSRKLIRSGRQNYFY